MNIISKVALFLFLGSSYLFSLEPYYKNSDGIAINGYDTVAYFTKRKAIEGNPKLKFKWKNAIWLFSTKKHLSLFKKSPKRYAPQFGGYCAWAVSQNYTAKTNPESWHIENKKLYLNYGTGVQRNWVIKIKENISNGEKNWPALLAK